MADEHYETANAEFEMVEPGVDLDGTNDDSDHEAPDGEEAGSIDEFD
jgi:hypothetical protein